MADHSFHRQPHNRARGKIGEAEAESWLEEQGYRIIERNVTTSAGEIDLVAREGEVLCFIEVKARASTKYGPAIAAVSVAKQRKIARAAALFLVRQDLDLACRFDVLGLDWGPSGWQYSLIRNAFEAPPH